MIIRGTGAVAVIWLLAVAPVATRAQQVAPPVQTTPERIELSTPGEPIRMLTEDAQHLVDRLGQGLAVSTPEPPAGGVSRTIMLEAPPVVNGSAKFVFQDATPRAEEARTTIPLAERKQAVEAYRQTLVRARGR